MDTSSSLKIQPLSMSPQLWKIIEALSHVGTIKITSPLFSYLDITDDFIHRVFPLLDYPGIEKPDYFNAQVNYLGAHISITYPEENTQIDLAMENKLIPFRVEGLFAADVARKRYVALKVDAPEILAIRAQYGLASTLQLKGYRLPPHITVATLLL